MLGGRIGHSLTTPAREGVETVTITCHMRGQNNPVQIMKRVEALTHIANGATQAEAAAAVHVSPRSVRRYLELHRLHAAIPLGPLTEALERAFREEEHRKTRTALFTLLVRTAEAQALVLSAKLRLDGGLPNQNVDANSPANRFLDRVFGDARDDKSTRKAARRAASLLRAAGLQ